ncbi:hypothetical protein [Enterococcus sp. AZ058]|uniref:hypothetical protein n=1 Tax=unclassified Enterococcus TaxID=2608891 RepID=UPI003D28D56B
MRISKYCKDKNMTLAEYKKYREAVEKHAEQAYEQASTLHDIGAGMYYSSTEIVKELTIHDHGKVPESFVINALKALGVEFMNDYQLYRIS